MQAHLPGCGRQVIKPPQPAACAACLALACPVCCVWLQHVLSLQAIKSRWLLTHGCSSRTTSVRATPRSTCSLEMSAFVKTCSTATPADSVRCQRTISVTIYLSEVLPHQLLAFKTVSRRVKEAALHAPPMLYISCRRSTSAKSHRHCMHCSAGCIRWWHDCRSNRACRQSPPYQLLPSLLTYSGRPSQRVHSAAS